MRLFSMVCRITALVLSRSASCCRPDRDTNQPNERRKQSCSHHTSQAGARMRTDCNACITHADTAQIACVSVCIVRGGLMARLGVSAECHGQFLDERNSHAIVQPRQPCDKVSHSLCIFWLGRVMTVGVALTMRRKYIKNLQVTRRRVRPPRRIYLNLRVCNQSSPCMLS